MKSPMRNLMMRRRKMKIKVAGIRSEVDKLIKDAAEHFQLYDPRIPEKDQCSGYFAFKEMCLMKEYICTYDEFVNHKNNSKYDDYVPVGYYLISRLHPNARQIIINSVNIIRGILERGEASKTIIVKK